jgi:isopentenyl phosphate kinase
MLIFLKLGGSLITDKTRPFCPRPEKIADLCMQIASALRQQPEMQLVIGHGSGSFGHEAARRYGTRSGVSGQEAWCGFAEVWYQAAALNRIVVEALHTAGLPALGLSPSAAVISQDGKAIRWDTYPLQSALANGLLPVIHGDVSFDIRRGGTILSTEDLFVYLAHALPPRRILLAGLEMGVWEDFPGRTKLLEQITPGTLPLQVPTFGGTAGTDVTGGMRSKMTEMLELVEEIPDLEAQIFSGEEPQTVQRALLGGRPGTCLHRA